MWCTFIALKRMCGPFISVLIFCWVTYWKAVFRRFKLLVLNTWSTSASHELCLTLVAQLKEMKVDTLSNVLSLRRLPSLWSSLPFYLSLYHNAKAYAADFKLHNLISTGIRNLSLKKLWLMENFFDLACPLTVSWSHSCHMLKVYLCVCLRINLFVHSGLTL